MNDYNVMINGPNLFMNPLKYDLVTFYSIRKIAIGRRNNHTTYCLLGYYYFKNYYSMIAIDLSEQQALDADPKVI